MNDLSELFAEGTAPEPDPAFALSVAAQIGRERLRGRLLALALPTLVVLALAGGALAAARLIEPVLVQLVAGSPQFMGVPVPLVLGALAAGLALGAGRYVLGPGAGIGAPEPIE